MTTHFPSFLPHVFPKLRLWPNLNCPLLDTSQSARSATRSEHLWLGSLRSQINCSLRSRSSLTQRSNHIQLGSRSLATDTACFARTESHTKAGFISPALALLASGAPWWQIWAPPSGKTLLALLEQSHTKTGVIRPSLALLASGAPWWQICAT